MNYKNTFETIAAACRYNSGKHFLDSGGESGRSWQQPAIEEQGEELSLELYKTEVTPTLETAHFLANTTTVDADISQQFDDWQEREEGDWFELGERFATEVLGLNQRERDNTYNNENDLSQCYVWECYTSKDDYADWIYCNDALLVVYIHTGADIRGGYSNPLFLRSKGEYALPVNLMAEFYAIEGRDGFGNELSQMELESLGEHWINGYSTNPSYELSKQIDRIFTHTHKDTSFIAKLKSGEIVRIQACQPYND